MIYLCEREIGYDAQCIGFPSIGGCRAVVVLTAGGMFGFHLNGSLSPQKKNKFAQFISTHLRGGTGTAIYAATTDARGAVTTATYDLNGYMQSCTDPAGGTTTPRRIEPIEGSSRQVTSLCQLLAAYWRSAVDLIFTISG